LKTDEEVEDHAGGGVVGAVLVRWDGIEGIRGIHLLLEAVDPMFVALNIL
jgi:hypothetical protein